MVVGWTLTTGVNGFHVISNTVDKMLMINVVMESQLQRMAKAGSEVVQVPLVGQKCPNTLAY